MRRIDGWLDRWDGGGVVNADCDSVRHIGSGVVTLVGDDR